MLSKMSYGRTSAIGVCRTWATNVARELASLGTPTVRPRKPDSSGKVIAFE